MFQALPKLNQEKKINSVRACSGDIRIYYEQRPKILNWKIILKQSLNKKRSNPNYNGNKLQIWNQKFKTIIWPFPRLQASNPWYFCAWKPPQMCTISPFLAHKQFTEHRFTRISSTLYTILQNAYKNIVIYRIKCIYQTKNGIVKNQILTFNGFQKFSPFNRLFESERERESNAKTDSLEYGF